ncbi:alpha-ketoglutarate-dependent dioxygenase AlkB [Sphingomonas koreensis]|nr:alpha-ketoglutarate-dependent dioxygenase AlkB [Sphingomonas koreensis]
MTDLFDTPLLPGLRSANDIVTPRQEASLIAAIDAANPSPFRFQGWLGKRLTHSFGWHYDFDTGRFAAVDPIPGWLEPIRRQAEAFAGVEPGSLVQALVIRYDIGAGIGWHRDRPHFDQVVGLSLGHAAAMRFRRRVGERFDRAVAPLVPRSAYHLSGEARHDWEHSIAGVTAPRWSITFRSLSEKGRLLGKSADADRQ